MESPVDVFPDRLGEFAILGVLGQGGTGVVYAARRGEQSVALKVLRKDQAPTGRERQRFLDEARHMGKLRHRGIVRVLDAGELDDGRPFLAMERLEGQNLGQRIEAGTLDRDLALDLFDQIATAVQAMHDEGLIHRDLKPENVMLVDGGKRAVLLDFGIAKPADAPPSTTTQAGLQRGTPAYMAPERFFGARATTCSDIYELGVILYVMLCGQLPWDPLDAKARLAPKGPSAHGVEVPETVERILMRALSSTEEERPASAAQFARDIKNAAWVTAETVLALPPTEALTGQPTKLAIPPAPKRATPAPVGAYVAAAAVLVAGGVVLTLWLVRLPSESGPSELSRVAKQIRGDASAPQPAAAPAFAVPDDAAVPLDAGALTSVADAAPGATRTKTTPDAAVARVPDATPGVSPVRGARLPACRKLLDLYCNDEFEATEGNLAGALCRETTENVERWEAMPSDARAEMARSCKEMYPDLKAAAQERIRQFHVDPLPPED